jgi:hypothetical protein
VLKLLVAGFHAGDYLAAACTFVENAVKHCHKVRIGVKVLAIPVVLACSGYGTHYAAIY